MSAIVNQQRSGGSLLDAVLGSVLDDLARTAGPDGSGGSHGSVGGVGAHNAGETNGADEAHGADGASRTSGPGKAGEASSAPRRAPVVLDCGGGSGSRAVPLAVRGAAVTVIDSSIDALAILARRAAEAGVAERVRGVQADVESLTEVAQSESADLVLVHGVLDVTRDPAQVLAAAAAVVRSGGYLSVVVPNPVATVLARALAGDLSSALAELIETDPGAAGPAEVDSGAAGQRPTDAGGTVLADAARPGGAVLFDLDRLRVLVEAAGLEVTATQGLGAFSSSVPGSVLDGQPAARRVLDELDRQGAVRSPYREIAGRLHLLARRPNRAAPA